MSAIVEEQIAWWKAHDFEPSACLAALGYKIRLGRNSTYVVEWGRRRPVDWHTVERAVSAAVLSLMEERGAA